MVFCAADFDVDNGSGDVSSLRQRTTFDFARMLRLSNGCKKCPWSGISWKERRSEGQVSSGNESKKHPLHQMDLAALGRVREGCCRCSCR